MTTPTQPSEEAVKAAVAIHERNKKPYMNEPCADPDDQTIKRYASIIDAHFAEVRSAAVTVLKGFDEGVFVRDTCKDREPGWAVKLLPYIVALGKLKKFTEPTPQKGRGE